MPIPGLEIDWDSNVPVYRQIADGVRAASVAGRPGAIARARHFARVVAELPQAWPSMPERATNS